MGSKLRQTTCNVQSDNQHLQCDLEVRAIERRRTDLCWTAGVCLFFNPLLHCFPSLLSVFLLLAVFPPCLFASLASYFLPFLPLCFLAFLAFLGSLLPCLLSCFLTSLLLCLFVSLSPCLLASLPPRLSERKCCE